MWPLLRLGCQRPLLEGDVWALPGRLRPSRGGAAAFGHRFKTRLGTGGRVSGEWSPVFVQWLDCVYQLAVVQYPQEFEFGESFLLYLAEACFSNRFGTFLADCEKELLEIKDKTLSLWTEVLIDPGRWKNPAHAPQRQFLPLHFAQCRLRPWDLYWFKYHPRPGDELPESSPPGEL